MGINFNRGEPIKYYSSDRISSLIANGLLTFLQRGYYYEDFFEDKKEAIFFKNKKELIHKIKYYLLNDKERINISKNGCLNYHKKFSNTNVVKFILAELKFTKDRINWFKK